MGKESLYERRVSEAPREARCESNANPLPPYNHPLVQRLSSHLAPLAHRYSTANAMTISVDYFGHETYDTSDTSNNQYQVWSDSKRNGDITKLLDDILCAAPCRGDCSKYELNSGRNCWSGHGGTDIDDVSIGVMDLSECLALCDDLDGCEGVVVENDNGGKGNVNCYRKKNIVLADCDWWWPFDTYTKK